jgi:TRAP transporter TAXI family solute receptor
MKTFVVIFFVLLLRFPAWALTIATGSAEGTYFRIAQDIKQISDPAGLPIEIMQTNGSFDNINLLGSGKVDLAIMQLDVLRFVTEIMLKQTGVNVLQEARVVLNLYPEEIHIISRNDKIRTIKDLQGKKVAVGPEKSGSALTAEVLLAGFELNVESSTLRKAPSRNSPAASSTRSSLSPARLCRRLARSTRAITS